MRACVRLRKHACMCVRERARAYVRALGRLPSLLPGCHTACLRACVPPCLWACPPHCVYVCLHSCMPNLARGLQHHTHPRAQIAGLYQQLSCWPRFWKKEGTSELTCALFWECVE